MFIAACGQIWTVYLSSETRESEIGVFSHRTRCGGHAYSERLQSSFSCFVQWGTIARISYGVFWLPSLEEPTLETKGLLLPCYLQEDLLGLNLNNFGSGIEFITGGDDVRFICSSRLEDRLRGCALVGGQACAK